MWYTWTTLVLVCCALVQADGEAGAEASPLTTTRAPPRTLDRQAAELAWKSWLQSPENGNLNAPPRRITPKSLFITPLVCPKGQRLDRNGCIQVVTVNKDEHERILLEQLNALFTAPPNGAVVNTDVIYDYGEEEPGPFQLTIPIGLDPQAAPLQGQEPSAQAQELKPNYVKIDKKDGNKPDGDLSIEAELELMKLQNNLNNNNTSNESPDILNHNIILTNKQNFSDKPKRDSPDINVTETETSSNNATDLGQKELVYGQVNVDPILYITEKNTEEITSTETNLAETNNSTISLEETTNENENLSTTRTSVEIVNDNKTEITTNSNTQLKKNGDQSKLNPETDYSDIGEAIKLISRYADVTTDDNFTKEQHKQNIQEESILGTRTKLQYRRNKPKEQHMATVSGHVQFDSADNTKTVSHDIHKPAVYYRYPWPNQHSPTPPPDYPFHHLQDYWPARNQIGGVYNTHENPRRHHHSYPHNFKLYNAHQDFGIPPAYPEQLKRYIHRVFQKHGNPLRPHSNNQDLYSLLGLRHWFSGEGTTKR